MPVGMWFLLPSTVAPGSRPVRKAKEKGKKSWNRKREDKGAWEQKKDGGNEQRLGLEKAPNTTSGHRNEVCSEITKIFLSCGRAFSISGV